MRVARRCYGLGIGLFLAAALAGSALVGSALAQQPTQAQGAAIRQACRSDYQAHCASVPSGGSAAISCLQQNAASLSAPCQQALAAVAAPSATAPSTAAPPAAPPPAASAPVSPREAMRAVRAHCAEDYRRFCRGVRLGGGAALACLKSHGPSLSQGCQQTLTAMP